MRIKVVAHPNAKIPRVEKTSDTLLQVYTTASPIDGKANISITKQLASYFKTKKNQVILVSGAKGKFKLFEIET